MTATAPVPDSTAWQAVMRRDRKFDGRFVTGVVSTGIYCRPSCAARHPARKNVRFFASAEEARAAGLRPCKRCCPDEIGRDQRAVEAVIEHIRTSRSRPVLAELARMTGYSPTHLQRLFSRATGLSPAAYARAVREERVRRELGGAARVSDAIYDAGFEAPSRFYEQMKDRMGMNASEWKRGGAGRVIHFAIIQTSLGEMLVAATDKGVCCLSFGEGEADLQRRFPKAQLCVAGQEFLALFEEVTRAVERPDAPHDVPLDVQGTAFQQRVWQVLRQIPPGETRSYGQIAALLRKPKASRAVGSANGANRVAVLIPCHRVIAADGSLGGYAYGERIKSELLKRERRKTRS